MLDHIPRSNEDDAIDRVSRAIADGEAVDWEAVRSTLPAMRTELDNLQTVQAISRVCDALEEPMATPDPSHGEPVLFTWRHLQVLERIGQGRHGVVYRAFDPILQMEVALKLLRDGESESATEHFLGEARRLAKIRHENVVRVHGADVSSGQAGLWTDLIVGETLEERLGRGPMSEAETIGVGADLCRALAALHEQQLVHGDVKPSNVMRRDRDGAIILMDFGTVRECHPEAHSSLRRYGTPLTMAPELILGDDPPTPRADVYSLGVLLYRLVTNRYPVEATTYQQLERMHERHVAVHILDRNPELSHRYVSVVTRAIAFDASQRFGSMGELQDALVDVLRLARHRSWWRRTRQRIRTIPRAYAAALTVAVGITGAVLLFPSRELEVDALFARVHGEQEDSFAASGQLCFSPGDRLLLRIRCSRPAHVYLFNESEVEPGVINTLYPTEAAERRPLAADVLYTLPHVGTTVWELERVAKEERLLLVVSRESLEDLDKSIEGSPRGVRVLRGFRTFKARKLASLKELSEELKMRHAGTGDVWLRWTEVTCPSRLEKQ